VRGEQVGLRAVKAGQATLRIVNPDDGSSYGELAIDSRPIEAINIGCDFDNNFDRDPVVFWPGPKEIRVSLLGAGRVDLSDDSMKLEMDGATQFWDRIVLPELALGHHPLLVTAGEPPPRVVDVEIVDQIDTIEMQQEPLYFASGSGFLCFKALDTGRFVAKVPWRFSATGGLEPQGNCVHAGLPGWGTVHPPTSFTIVASVGTLSRTFTIPIP
jgi:hypothetical protein